MNSRHNFFIGHKGTLSSIFRPTDIIYDSLYDNAHRAANERIETCSAGIPQLSRRNGGCYQLGSSAYENT